MWENNLKIKKCMHWYFIITYFQKTILKKRLPNTSRSVFLFSYDHDNYSYIEIYIKDLKIVKKKIK